MKILVKKEVLFLLAYLTIGVHSYSQTLEGSFESKFKRYQKNETFSGASTQDWSVVAWKGERINTQIVLWSSEAIENIKYKLGSLKKIAKEQVEINSEFIKLRFPSYVKGDVEARSCTTVVEGKGFDSIRNYIEIADALLETPITKLSPENPIKLWLTIDVPEDQPAGNYIGNIGVFKNKKELMNFTVKVEVIDYQLPKPEHWKFHLDIWQWPLQPLKFYNISEKKVIKAWSKDHFELLEPFYSVLANMGQKVIFTKINQSEEPLVKWIKKSNNSWYFDFNNFDSYVSRMENWGIHKQISCHSTLGSKNNRLPYFNKESDTMEYLELEKWSKDYNVVWSQFLMEFKQHLIKKGWFEKTVLYFDELRQGEMDQVISFMQEFDSDWKLAMAYGHVQSKNTMNLLHDASGILGVANTNGRKDKISTFYTSCTENVPNNYTTHNNSVAEMTWMPWHSARESMDGYLRWAYDYWRKKDPFDTRDGGFTSGDFSMIYRSKNGKGMKPVMGIRTEMLREGIQDFEKIGILRAHFLKNKDYKKMKSLESVINKFSASSGVHAESLVKEAQSVLIKLTQEKTIEDSKIKFSGIDIQYNKDFNQIIIDIQKEFFEVEVLTYSGKRILLQEYEEPIKSGKIDLSNLPPDFYLIRIKTKGSTYVEVVKLE